jgi:hypothetical protein
MRVYTFLLNHPQFGKIESVERGVKGEGYCAPPGDIRAGLSDRQPRRHKGKRERGGRGGTEEEWVGGSGGKDIIDRKLRRRSAWKGSVILEGEGGVVVGGVRRALQARESVDVSDFQVSFIYEGKREPSSSFGLYFLYIILLKNSLKK